MSIDVTRRSGKGGKSYSPVVITEFPGSRVWDVSKTPPWRYRSIAFTLSRMSRTFRSISCNSQGLISYLGRKNRRSPPSPPVSSTILLRVGAVFRHAQTSPSPTYRRRIFSFSKTQLHLFACTSNGLLLHQLLQKILLLHHSISSS